MFHRVLITSWPFSDHGDEQKRRLIAAGCEIHDCRNDWPFAEDRLMELLPGVHAIVATSDAYTRRALSAADSLRVIARWGVGYDSIDLAAASQLGVVVTNTPGYLSEAVADMTFGLILSLSRGIPFLNEKLHRGEFVRREFIGGDVWKKTLGIVGLGDIGKAVARRAAGFQMEILASDPRHDETFAREHGVRYVTLDELLSRSDFVTLHCDLSPEARGLIGETQLRMMKPTAFFLNAARGAVLDETALARALREGWIAGAAIDAFQKEPLPADHPFLALSNCLLTPHIASVTHETIAAINGVVSDSVLDVLQGRRPKYVVNPEVFQNHGNEGVV